VLGNAKHFKSVRRLKKEKISGNVESSDDEIGFFDADAIP
jgi:hypothetical protein